MMTNGEECRMRIGGNALNDGVQFRTDNFTSTIKVNKDGTHQITIKETKTKTSKTVIDVPVIRAIISIFNANKLLPIVVALSLGLDIYSVVAEHNAISNAVTDLVFIIYGVISLLLLALLIKKTLHKAKETIAFHGAEHKVIYAYHNNYVLNLENVRKCPRIARRCGTNLIAFLIPLFIIAGFVSPYSGVNLIVTYVIAYEMFNSRNGDNLPVTKHFFKLGYWCQEKLFTSEPSDEQLISTINALKKLLEKETVK